MANTKSAQKAMRQGTKRAVRNKSARSAVRTYFKKATVAVSGSVTDAAEVVRAAVRELDRAVQKGIVHRNAAARRKSRLMARLHQLSLTPAEPTPTRVVVKADARRPRATAKAPVKRPASGARAAAAADKKPAAATSAPRKPSARKTSAKPAE